MPINRSSDGGARTQVYSSVQMSDRRRRILEAARELLVEKGLDGLSMRELSLKAEVALRTLYNAYRSKDHLVALAVQEYYAEFVAKTKYRFERGTMEGVIERLLLVHRRNLRIKNYTRAIMSIYFSADIEKELWDTIQSMSKENYSAWLQDLADKRQLSRWVDIDGAADRLANLEYATLNEWCQGRIPDDRLLVQLLGSVLTFVHGLTRGATTKAVGLLLEELSVVNLGRGDGPLLQAALTAQERAGRAT